MPRVTLTISHVEGPSGLWVARKLLAVKRSKYPPVAKTMSAMARQL